MSSFRRRSTVPALAALLLLVSAAPARAAVTVAELEQLCTSSEPEHITSCNTFVHGLLDGLDTGFQWGAGDTLHFIESQRRPPPDAAQAKESVKKSLQAMSAGGRLSAYCLPAQMDMKDLVKLLLPYLQQVDPQRSAAWAVFHALRAEWEFPCKTAPAQAPKQ